MTTETLDAQGLLTDDTGAIRTASGLRVNPLTMTAEHVRITDIARALSAQCRYNGHCYGHLSVARHCLWVAAALLPHGRRMALCGLLHDAAETYLGDLVRPLKHTRFGETYLEAEEYVEGVVFGALGLPCPLPAEVAAADNAVLGTELDGLRWTWDGNARHDEAAFLNAYAALSRKAAA